MHIVFLSSEYPLWAPGGVGTFLQTFGRALVKKGHRVTVMGPGKEFYEEKLDDEGVILYRLPKKKGILPSFLHNTLEINKKLKSLEKEIPIDIIESAEGGLALLFKTHAAKKVIRLHGGHHFFAEAEKRGINWRKGLLEKRSFAKADGFIAVSQYVKNHTEKYLSYHNKPITVINHPIDTSINIPEVSIKVNHILFAGTVCEKKGVRQLLEAFQIVKETYPKMILDIYGRDWYYPDGRSYIEMLKNTYEISFFNNVIFHGSVPRDELNIHYAEARFCIFPSHMETQGLVTLEAMLFEKAVIFSEYGPGPETIVHKETGLLCDVYDPQDIAEKMVWYIEHPEEAIQFGKNAREKVMITYDKNTILEKNIVFYSKLISNA